MPFLFLAHHNSWSFLYLNTWSFQYLASQVLEPLVICPLPYPNYPLLGLYFWLFITSNYNFSIISISSIPHSNCLISQPNPSAQQFPKPTGTSNSLILHIAPYNLTPIYSVESVDNDFNHFLAEWSKRTPSIFSCFAVLSRQISTLVIICSCSSMPTCHLIVEKHTVSWWLSP